METSEGQHGAALYQLTDDGPHPRDVLFELVLFGGTQPAPQNRVKPGNHRTVATTLGAAAARLDTRGYAFEAELIVDGEAITLTIDSGTARAVYAVAKTPDVLFRTGYIPLFQASEGEISLHGLSGITVS